MEFHHSTHWTVLEKLLQTDLIEPQPFAREDLKNPALAALDRSGVECTWFSSQAWTDNRFGPYILRFPPSELVSELLVDLGKHNGARCYLSAPPRLARWAGVKTGCQTFSSNDTRWHRATKEDRVDLLVTWQVPISYSLYFVKAKTGGPSLEDDANYATSRFLARMILTGDKRFNASLSDPTVAQNAGTLLRSLLRNFDGHLDTAAKTSQGLAGAQPEDVIRDAMAAVVKADLRGAVTESARLGTITSVANALASLVNAHFGTSLTGAEIQAAA